MKDVPVVGKLAEARLNTEKKLTKDRQRVFGLLQSWIKEKKGTRGDVMKAQREYNADVRKYKQKNPDSSLKIVTQDSISRSISRYKQEMRTKR